MSPSSHVWWPGIAAAMRRAATRVALGALCAVAGIAAAAPLQPGAPFNVSTSAAATEKAKPMRLAYRDGEVYRKAWLVVYGEGPEGRQNVYARHSFDDGATWSSGVLLSRDGAGAPTGGQLVTTRDAITAAADNDKPLVFAPPVTSGPMVLVSWNSAYCPPEPAASPAHAGPYTSSRQGTGDLDEDGTAERPFHCVWVATTTDPALAKWNVHQLTDAQRDAIGDMVGGSSAGNAFALVWQEDPGGLQPGEAEGHGDGGTGAHVTGGTNIWYAFASRPDGATLRASIVQLTDNNATGMGQPGASRPNIHLSGNTAAVAYEETACPGGSGGKCIVYHSFPYNSPDRDAAGTIVSDVTHSARRARIVMQGAAAAGTSPLRTLLLWRESSASGPSQPADIVVRRGLVDTVARPGSTGFKPGDLLAEPPQFMTAAAASGGNANAHRAVINGRFVGLAYDLSPSMTGADARITPVPTATYNLFFARSDDSGAAGSWSAPVNLSNLQGAAMTVVEPRLVATPATVVNPFTGVPDPGDTRDTDVLYVAYATQHNTVAGESGRVYVARSTDKGRSFEPFAPVSADAAGQSESQLRPMPDGSSAMVLWMGEQAPGDAQTKDAMMAVVTAPLPDLVVQAAIEPFDVGGQRTLSLTVTNKGPGDARRVAVSGTVPEGVTPVGIGEPGACTVQAQAFTCTIAELEAAQSLVISLAVSTDTAGSYPLSASVTSAVADGDAADNEVVASVLAAQPAGGGTTPPPPLPEPLPVDDGTGGGCTAAHGDRPLDPLLPLLAALALAGAARPRRARAHSRASAPISDSRSPS